MKNKSRTEEIQKQLEGARINNLLVLFRAGCKSGHAMWLCLCTCGRHKRFAANTLLRGSVKDCGCCNKSYRKADANIVLPQNLSVLAQENQINKLCGW